MGKYDDQIEYWSAQRNEAELHLIKVRDDAASYPPSVYSFLIKHHEGQIAEAEHFIEVMRRAAAEG